MTMEIDRPRQRRLHDDHRMSGNWSFGSNYRPSSQSRKMSIGIVVDSSAKMKNTNSKGVVAELRNSQNVSMSKNIPAETEHKRKEAVSPDLEKQNKAPCQESTPLIQTKTPNQNISYANTNGHPKSNVQQQPSGSKGIVEMEPGSYFANQMSILQSRDTNIKKPMDRTYQREEGNNGDMGRDEESVYATPQKVPMSGKGPAEQGTSGKENGGSVSLRLKIQELLGTVRTPNKEEQHIPETSPMDANIAKPKSTNSKKDSPISILRQHLNTSKTISGSLDQKVKRPVTRSSTRKKPQAQKSVPKKKSPLSSYKQANLDENAFAFVETWSRRLSTDVNHGSKTFKRKERETFGTSPVKTCVVEDVHKDEYRQPTAKRKTKDTASHVSLYKNRAQVKETVKPNTEMKETARHQFEGKKGTSLPNVDQDPFAKDTVTKNVEPHYDLKSPTFELKTPGEMSPPKSVFQTNQEDLDVDSLSEESFKTKRSCRSQSKGFSKGGKYRSKTKDLDMDSQDSPVIESDPIATRAYKENRRSSFPSEVLESESQEDVSPISVPIKLKNPEGKKWAVSPCEDEDSQKSEDDSPIKRAGDTAKFSDSSVQDGLAGAVKLFALALERVQSKIQSTTSRQSAAILLSVSKNMHSQLQNAESKIQNEVGKLTDLGKSNRMHTENQYKEQQEQLKQIFEKFKEEVDQHLSKCQTTLEGLEAHQVQVRGMVEKQRLSHKKFIQQTEQAIETQLNDAQKKIADVHRMAKEKMLKLKYGIAGCLKEGLLS
uniref:meiosis-specific protein ASY3 n=1 Tax=Erigeron canadensis TaxID=72917 RepID=UPI001CB8AF8C|nr:meiosis-specific protein ASY3 [Erigeron canadensis]